MKISTIALLPLLASAAVIPSIKHETVQESHDIHELDKRQMWASIGNSLQKNLPSWIQWAADNVTWMLKLQEKPVKKIKLVPSLDQLAQKAVFRYGPWQLTGSQVHAQWGC
jgi:hypothetical protein